MLLLIQNTIWTAIFCTYLLQQIQFITSAILENLKSFISNYYNENVLKHQFILKQRNKNVHYFEKQPFTGVL